MAFDYGSMRSMATNLLSEFGNSFVLKKPNGKPVYNAVTKKTSQNYLDYSGYCVMKTYSAEAIGSLSNIINAGDVSFVCTMDDISVVPEVSTDKIVYGGKTYNIIDIATSNPSGAKIVVHTIHARRAS